MSRNMMYAAQLKRKIPPPPPPLPEQRPKHFGESWPGVYGGKDVTIAVMSYQGQVDDVACGYHTPSERGKM
jgi:hypothetical protein